MGGNSFGQLETAQRPPRVRPYQSGSHGCRASSLYAAGAGRLRAVENGTVWAWGDNSLGQLGGARCGSLTAGHRSPCLGSRVPREVPGLAGVVAIAAGGDSGYALRNDGSVWAWGDDGFGELGNGLVLQDEPVRPGACARHVISVTAGSCSGYALRSDGTVWAWGRGDLGQLGDGRQQYRAPQCGSESSPTCRTSRGEATWRSRSSGTESSGHGMPTRTDSSATPR